ncbi:histone acetylation protein-domain-containing protein [Pholiota molesta]|nr:histone acetylation protein-domain-containing protein [Pholiota molesta]
MSSQNPSSDPSPPQQNLRDHILEALASHPGTREFHVHALVSAPRRTGDLFPFATPRSPRVWVQDILVLLSEQPLDGGATGSSSGAGNAHQADEDDGTPPRPRTPPPKTQRPPRILVSAVEAALYIVPSTACGILYVSKVDSTGYAAAPSPTARLVRAVLSYFIDPATRPAPARELVRHLYVHVFARAQAQYLFSASADWEGKKPLGDTGLCAWWRRVLGRVAGEVVERNQKASEKEDGEKKKEEEGGLKVKMYHILPGFGALEAEHALRNATPAGAADVTLPVGLQWVYGHPYAQTDGTPLPCPQPPAPTEAEEGDGLKRRNGYGNLNLGCIIPSFDDDPKSRFMDEIAYTTDGELKSPQRKRARTAVEVVGRTGKSGSDAALPAIGDVLAGPKNSASLEARGKGLEEGRNAEEGGGSVPVIVGAEKEKERERPLGELGKVTPDEFWERMSFRQECVAGAVTGFFTLVVSTGGRGEGEGTGGGGAAAVLGPQTGQVPGQVHKRILTTLLTGVEFSTRERAAKATETVEGAIRGLCEGGRVPVARERLEVPRTPPRRRGVPMEVTPNPFPEAVATASTYGEWIYGRVAARNAAEGRAVVTGPAVRVLAVRRKKKAL